MNVLVNALSLTELITFISTRSAYLQSLSRPRSYELYGSDGLITMYYSVDRFPTDTTELTTFETSYLPTSNRRLKLSLASLTATTNSSGLATISVQIPGTFSNLNPNASGRFLHEAHVWSDDPLDGDKFSNIKIIDSDSILTAVPKPGGGFLSSLFPAYPTIRVMSDDGVASGNEGIYLKPDKVHVIKPINQMVEYEFVPSGFYLTADYQSAAGGGLVVKSGRVVRCNLIWGTYA